LDYLNHEFNLIKTK
jgi:hypothetical protein